MINVNQNLNACTTWQNKLDFFTSSSPVQQPENSTVTSVALKNIFQIAENKKDIINQTVFVWQSWKNGDAVLKEKALAIFLSLHEECLGKETPLQVLDEMMSEWQNDPTLLTKVARNLEKNNPTLFKELQDKKLVFSVRVGEEGKTRLYSKALLEKNASYLFRMINFGGAENDLNTGIVTLPDEKIFNYMLKDLESSLIDDPSERKKEQMSKASTFIKSFDSVNDLISDIFEYNLVSVEDALVNLVGDTLLEPTKESSEFLQKVRSSESLLIAPAAELKKRIETVDKALTFLKNRTSFNLLKSIITVNNQRELDEIIKDIETITRTGYVLHIKRLTIKNIEDRTSINLSSIPKSAIACYRLGKLDSLKTINFGQAEKVEILYCDQLNTIQGTVKEWIFCKLNALRTVDIGQAENVKIWYCERLKTIQGTAKKWNLTGLNALRTVDIGQAENATICSCDQLKTIQGTAKEWILFKLNALRTVDIGQAENIDIKHCDQLKTIQGTAKTWDLIGLKALTTVDVGQAKNVKIWFCDQLKIIQGTAKTWHLMDLKALTTVDVGRAKNVKIWGCEQLKTIQGTAKTWNLMDLKALTTVNVGRAENIDIKHCDQLKTIQGTAKAWKLFKLNALKKVDIGQAENVLIKGCYKLKVIQGRAKTWDLMELKALTMVDLNKAETVNITNCSHINIK